MIHSLRPSPASNRFQLLNFEEELGDDMAFVRKDCCDYCETAESAEGCKAMIGRCCPPGITYRTISCESCVPCASFVKKEFLRGDEVARQVPRSRIDSRRQTALNKAREKYFGRRPR